MTDLPDEEFLRLYQLIEKARKGEASSKELEEIIELIEKSGARTRYDIEQFISQAGFTSLEELHRHIKEKKSQEFIETLVAIGLGILAAYAIIKMFEKK